jgi:NitT/TauT family transport system ATP-binding protein
MNTRPPQETTQARDADLCALHDVWHEFPLPNGKPRAVLENIHLAIRRNEVVALLGPSGCGKSTILRILAGLIRPTRGQVTYHGKPLQGLNPGVAMVFQSFALFPWMTVTANVEVVLEAAGLEAEAVAERTARVLRLVGLAGFEEAYPRELSGGMKQRVGMARAFSMNPEMLFMDEPFSQVDALTAETLRSEVLDLWALHDENPSSILLVSHDIKEVAYMADRIVVLGANPGTIRTVVENRLPRPRDYRSGDLGRLVDHLHDIITGHEMPDAPEAPTSPARAEFEPIPCVAANEVVGLLEFLDARGGNEDLFRIAADTHHEFGQMIAVTKAAELLDLVDTPKRQVVLTAVGSRFVAAGAEERQAIWSQRILGLRLFQEVRELVQRHGKVDEALIMEIMALRMPNENYEQMFRAFVGWARFGNLFAYDERTGILSSP